MLKSFDNQMLKSFDEQFPNLVPNRCCMALSAGGMLAVCELVDWHCQNPECDCYIVEFTVNTQTTTFATIIYGWKPVSFYQQIGCNKQTATQLTQGLLNPLAQQGLGADILLEHFSMMTEDPLFIERIAKRYAMVREAISVAKPTTRSDNVIRLQSKQRR